MRVTLGATPIGRAWASSPSGAASDQRLGVTVCRLVTVGERSVQVQGLDAIDGTPVLEIKPVMRAFLPRGEVVEPSWVGELMTGYWDGPNVADVGG